MYRTEVVRAKPLNFMVILVSRLDLIGRVDIQNR
jgi:hypothetical protein